MRGKIVVLKQLRKEMSSTNRTDQEVQIRAIGGRDCEDIHARRDNNDLSAYFVHVDLISLLRVNRTALASVS